MPGQFVLPTGDSITIEGEAARRLMGSGSGDAALLYIYILSNGGRYDGEDAAGAIHRTREQADGALDVLCRLGLVTLSNAAPKPAGKLERPEELPRYTPQDIDRELKNGQEFKALVNEVQKVLGAQLSSEGLMTLFGIYDYLRLPTEVILTLVQYCVSEFASRGQPGRRPSMRYIEKTAYAWEREGIFSLEAAEDFIKRQSAYRSSERELAPILGLTGRALSATERRYINSWTDMGFTTGAIAEAYDRTVTKTGRLTWRYMDSILKSWHSKGLHTTEEIAGGDAPPKFTKPRAGRPGPQTGATAGELEAMRATLRKIKGEG